MPRGAACAVKPAGGSGGGIDRLVEAHQTMNKSNQPPSPSALRRLAKSGISESGPTLRRRQAKLARSVGESPTQVMLSRQPGSECCVSRRRRRPRSVHSGCVGCVIEPRNGYVAGAETVQRVERNMGRAAKRGHARPAGVEEQITRKRIASELGRSRVWPGQSRLWSASGRENR
jgi:hypothetical protein